MSRPAQETLIVTTHRLASLRQDQRRSAEALSLYGDARAIIRKRVEQDPTRRNLYLLGNNLSNVADVHFHANQRGEAAAAFEESAVWLKRTLDKEPTDAVARENLINVHLGQARMAEQDRNLDRARER